MSLCVSLFIALSRPVCLTSSILHDYKNIQDSISGRVFTVAKCWWIKWLKDAYLMRHFDEVAVSIPFLTASNSSWFGIWCVKAVLKLIVFQKLNAINSSFEVEERMKDSDLLDECCLCQFNLPSALFVYFIVTCTGHSWHISSTNLAETVFLRHFPGNGILIISH